MIKKQISNGSVHKTPEDLRKILASKATLYNIWEDLTVLARNEWICWITSAKKLETRDRRIKIMQDKLDSGERRPCCWAGCPHR